MVAGTYLPIPDRTGPDENPDYTRNDGFTSTAGTTPDAFLMRLRRTSDRDPLAREDGVSTSGPPVPFLFGRGATISAVPGSNYNPRRDGVTVRAAAIAQLVPAKTAGPVSQDESVRGITPFALRRADWAALGSGAASFTVGTNGVVTVGSGTSAVGQLIDATRPLTIAQRIDDRVATVLPASFVSQPGLFILVPLYDDDLSPAGVKWVVGFGLMQVTAATVSSFTAQRLTGGTRISGESQPLANVSGAVLQQSSSAIPSDIPAATLQTVFSRNQDLAPGIAPADTGPYIALTPVLVR
jgi:hypothetical protein